MSGETRISYADVLRRQAAQVDNVADQYALVMDGGEYDTSEVQPSRLDAAALLALAQLVEWAEKASGQSGGLSYAAGSIASALAAGFPPSAEIF